MRKNNLTALLTDLRALILKSRPAYRDFLGETTELRTTKILENVVLAESQLTLPVADAAFSGFIAGRVYRVMLDGEEKSVVAKDFNDVGTLSNVEDFLNLPNDYWAFRYDSEEGKIIAAVGGAFLGATISVYYDGMVTTQKWSVKKLAYELLPDRLLSAISAAADTARKALTAANAALTTADAAQTTADAAQTTADAAFPRVGGGELSGPVRFISTITAPGLKIPVPDSESISRGIDYETEEGEDLAWISFDYNSNSKTSGINIGNNGYGSREYKKARITFSLGLGLGIFFSHDDEVYHMRCSGPLDFSDNPYGDSWTPILLQGISGIIMHSSTSGSSKKFKITVDDTGTLSATEVTDTIT